MSERTIDISKETTVPLDGDEEIYVQREDDEYVRITLSHTNGSSSMLLGDDEALKLIEALSFATKSTGA